MESSKPNARNPAERLLRVLGIAFDAGKDALKLLVGAGNHMDCNQLADPAGGSSACIRGGLHRCDISADQHGDQPGFDVFASDQSHVGGLLHRVRGFYGADQTARLNHSQSFHASTYSR